MHLRLGLTNRKGLLLLAALLLFGLFCFLGGLLDERQELRLARNILSQDLGHNETFLRLVVLKNAAQCSFSSTQSL